LYLGTIGNNMLSIFAFKSIFCHFGAARHFKSEIDGHFGVLAAALHDGASRSFLRTPEDVCRVYTEYFKVKQSANPNMMPQRVMVYLPDIERSKLPVTRFTLATCMGVRDSYCFSVTNVDTRRKDFHGVGPNWSTLTGLTLRNHGLSAHASLGAKTTHPIVAIGAAIAAPDPGEAADDIAPIVVNGTELALDCKFDLQWRCSYAKAEATDVKSTRIQTHLTKQHENLMHVRRPGEPTRHRDAGSAAVAAKAKAAKLAAQSRAETARFKRRRLDAKSAPDLSMFAACGPAAPDLSTMVAACGPAAPDLSMFAACGPAV
jgi:hypothetical protein